MCGGLVVKTLLRSQTLLSALTGITALFNWFSARGRQLLLAKVRMPKGRIGIFIFILETFSFEPHYFRVISRAKSYIIFLFAMVYRTRGMTVPLLG